MTRTANLLTLIAGLLGACSHAPASPSALEVTFLEHDALLDRDQTRLSDGSPSTVALFYHAQLKAKRTIDLQNVGEKAQSGQAVEDAARTVTSGKGVVLVAAGLRRPQEVDGTQGDQAMLSSWRLSLECGEADPQSSGDLNGCQGSLFRSSRKWPMELYDVKDATVTIIPDGGAVRGRLRLRAGGSRVVEISGPFIALSYDLSAAN